MQSRKIVLTMMLLFLLLLSVPSGVCAEQKVLSKTQMPGTESIEDMSAREWKKKETGSAGVLEGKSVLVSIYIEDTSSKWTRRAKKEANRKVCAAVSYIRKQAQKYDKKVFLIADTDRYEDIAYCMNVNMKISDHSENQMKLYRKVKKFIAQKMDVTNLRRKYGTDSIGFLLHVNKPGVCSSQVHFVESGDNYFYEASTLFAKYGKKPEGASTYAHEILHLFGARDLYEKSLEDGITSPFIKYVAKKFSNDIMYTTYTRDGRQLKYRITNKIGRITAYFLGWRKDIPERRRYAIPKLKKKGCFYLRTEY